MEEVSGKKVMILLGKRYVRMATSSYYHIMIHILSEALGLPSIGKLKPWELSYLSSKVYGNIY